MKSYKDYLRYFGMAMIFIVFIGAFLYLYKPMQPKNDFSKPIETVFYWLLLSSIYWVTRKLYELSLKERKVDIEDKIECYFGAVFVVLLLSAFIHYVPEDNTKIGYFQIFIPFVIPVILGVYKAFINVKKIKKNNNL